MSRRLPEHLHAAHGWTAAAGELAELASLSDDALAAYCAESEANARAHGDRTITASDLADLATWLVETSAAWPGARWHEALMAAGLTGAEAGAVDLDDYRGVSPAEAVETIRAALDAAEGL